MRNALAILFLTIFTFQVLPLKVLGKLLGSSQNIGEEIEDDAEGKADGKLFIFGEDQLVAEGYSLDEVANRLGFNNKVKAFIHKAESLPSVHVSEMLSPPPDLG